MNNNKKRRIVTIDETFKKNVTILVDSREKENSHILNVFKEMEINYDDKNKLDVGDYMYSYNGVVGDVIIERKNGLTELGRNVGKNRDRFKREFERAPKTSKIHLIVENSTLNSIYSDSVPFSVLHPSSYISNIMAFCYKYDIQMWMLSKSNIAIHILKIFYIHHKYKLGKL